MTILLTGATGFVGSHFLLAAQGAGHTVRALRRAPTSRPRIPVPEEGVQWIERSLAGVTPEDLRGIDVLVHLAAAGVDLQATWAESFQVNVTDSLALWGRALDAGVRRLVIGGSCFEYGRSGKRFDFIPPAAPLEPTGPYHASKAAATMAALGLGAERRAEMLVLRPFHVFGPGEAAHRFWPSLKAAAEAGRDLEMTRGEQVRDFVPVADVANRFLHGCERSDLVAGEPLIENVGTGRPRTLRAFAEEWWAHWGARGSLRFGARPYRDGEVMRYVPQIPQP